MKPIHLMHPEEFDAFMAWARYLYWCDLHRCRFITWFEESHDVKEGAECCDWWRFVALLSQWYGSLWVVIEGWKKARLADAVIDGLLDESLDYCELLRRYRNGVYHYQPRIIEPRLLDFLNESERTVPWVDTLHHEFLRFFEEMLVTIPGKKNQETLRKAIVDIIGWLPTDTEAAHLREFDQLCDQARAAVDKYGGPTTPGAQELLADIAHAREIAKDALLEYRAWRQRRVSFLTRKGTPH
ncbi:MAG: hypothetical protein A3G20_08395 [Acidobacteria bacterium RIFCSPLOWO2_12_FULL_59_11]|nr:MAG: hypothetical protein A3G20_08395 [Acidobacteria bacterium RIFCSPLOWO2_12_FULL_59_11]